MFVAVREAGPIGPMSNVAGMSVHGEPTAVRSGRDATGSRVH
jgi:hypothetical protein